MKSLVSEEWSPTLESRRVDILVRYLVAVFMFSAMGLKIPGSLIHIKGVSDFVKYNWPKAIHQHLHEQLSELSGRCALRAPDENLGYFEGCSVVVVVSDILLFAYSFIYRVMTYIVLQVWLYEHTKLQMIVDQIARPRICRWSSKLSYSTKVCSSHVRNLWIDGQICLTNLFILIDFFSFYK
ncbi:hypothetical protein KSP40_PGU018584 [Platanthera guangdongensis]|uniref:Uncharacterized protein n=1 Tax=Platanthera guangdongensis TaxID=2320717 RepID=A0ABR2LRH1_9ASPA